MTASSSGGNMAHSWHEDQKYDFHMIPNAYSCNEHFCYLLKLILDFVSYINKSFMRVNLYIKIELIYLFSENKLIELHNINCKLMQYLAQRLAKCGPWAKSGPLPVLYSLWAKNSFYIFIFWKTIEKWILSWHKRITWNSNFSYPLFSLVDLYGKNSYSVIVIFWVLSIKFP